MVDSTSSKEFILFKYHQARWLRQSRSNKVTPMDLVSETGRLSVVVPTQVFLLSWLSDGFIRGLTDVSPGKRILTISKRGIEFLFRRI